MWIEAKSFRLEPAGTTLSDRAVLAGLLSDDHYHDHYAGEPVEEQTRHSMHGPYRLAAIDADKFVPTGPRRAIATIRRWLADHITEASATDVEAVERRVTPALDGALYQLSPLGNAARHDWGWVVGAGGFHEFVAIDRSKGTLTLIVASDD